MKRSRWQVPKGQEAEALLSITMICDADRKDRECFLVPISDLIEIYSQIEHALL